MMSAPPNSHDSQYIIQNGRIKKDEAYVRIVKDTVKGYTSVPNNATTMSGY